MDAPGERVRQWLADAGELTVAISVSNSVREAVSLWMSSGACRTYPHTPDHSPSLADLARSTAATTVEYPATFAP